MATAFIRALGNPARASIGGSGVGVGMAATHEEGKSNFNEPAGAKVGGGESVSIYHSAMYVKGLKLLPCTRMESNGQFALGPCGMANIIEVLNSSPKPTTKIQPKPNEIKWRCLLEVAWPDTNEMQVFCFVYVAICYTVQWQAKVSSARSLSIMFGPLPGWLGAAPSFCLDKTNKTIRVQYT